MPSAIQMQSSFKIQLVDCFDDPQPSFDDWADISTEATRERPAIADEHKSFDILPNISLLPCPDDLLLKPPYHLTVYGGGKTTVEVQCSHSPTLELLAEYLKKWCKVNHQDTRHVSASSQKSDNIYAMSNGQRICTASRGRGRVTSVVLRVRSYV